jgi:PAS domain S-box-containing protein
MEPDIHPELLERFRFETLLADISASFVNVPANEVDREIESAQRAICLCLELDHSSLWQVSPDDTSELLLTHVYRDAALPPRPKRMTATEFFPWVQAKLQAKETICVPDTAMVPGEASRDRETWQQFGIKSTLGIPLSAGGGPVFGVLSFEATAKKRTWPEPLQKRLMLVAQIFANALERKHTERKLRESEERLSLAASSANAGLWTLNIQTGEIWATDKLRELLDLAAGEEINYEKLLAVVHPDDREMVQRAVQRVPDSGRETTFEYRIMHQDGTERWLASRGRLHSRSGSEPDILMGVTTDITESRRVQQELAEFAGRLLTAQEAESARIARELHDDLGQSIALFAVQLHKTTMLIQSKLPGRDDSLQNLREKIAKIAKHVSTLSHQLHSSELEFLGLAVAAKGLCREVSDQYAVSINFACDALPHMGSDIELSLFRVLQEALRNFVKHSNGKKADVRIRVHDGKIHLSVADEGQGFNMQKPSGKPGLGLISMEERMRLVGGKLVVQSRPGHGTTVEALAPRRQAT